MILKAIILGIIEGLTEFLPVSSTGHLIIANHYITFADKNFANMFDVVIQAGAILAVVVLFWKKIFPNFRDRAQSRNVYRLWLKVIVGFIPAAIIGVLLDDYINAHFFKPGVVAVALILGALLLLVAEKKLKRVKVKKTEDITYGQSFIIGIFQCLALWPGMSRSSSTIIGSLFMGFSREVAAEFSFILAIPTIVGASVFSLYKSLKNPGLVITSSDWGVLAVGTVVSFLVALVVVAFFINYLKKRKLAPFAYYRILLGIVVLALLGL